MADEKSGGNFVVMTPVRHDGNDYKPGEFIQLSKKQAAELGTSVQPRSKSSDGDVR